MTHCRIGVLTWFLLASLVAAAQAAPKGGDRDAADSAAPNLDGVWQGYVVEGKGENPNRGQTHLELTIKDNQITAQRLDGNRDSLGQGVYKLAPGRANVMLMDAMEVRTRGKPRTYQGIATATADELRWCVGANNRRPAGFETKGQQFLLILKRQK